VAEVAARYQVAIVAHLPAHAATQFLLDVKPEAALAAGDRLVVCGSPQDLENLSVQGSKVEVDVLWASWFRRNARVLGRTLSEIEMPVKICTVVLLVVIVLSTLILHLGVKRYRMSVALFRTISLLATGSDMHEEDYDTDWLKVYVSSLRIAGAALTAAFIAIVTNYLLRARLGGALEIRRIPDRGHVIVCGVGNIGYRVIEELLACGERVAAIEVARDSRFVPTARRQGVPVIIGDATVREVLRQAHAATARAVIAATSHDLINLEVALLARDLNPHQRVVLRLSDPHLADMLRESANIQMALSVAVLSAPAFVASLFGDRVLSLCLVEGRLIAVVNLRIGAQDLSLAGASVRDTAALYRLLPLAVITAEGTHQPLNVALKPGDQLIGFIALADMERLLRRETA
jgi:Trk K+ transport system NAD-binding subunit